MAKHKHHDPQGQRADRRVRSSHAAAATEDRGSRGRRQRREADDEAYECEWVPASMARHGIFQPVPNDLKRLYFYPLSSKFLLEILNCLGVSIEQDLLRLQEETFILHKKKIFVL